MSQDPAEEGGAMERELPISRTSRFRRTLVLVLVSLGIVSGGAIIGATAAGAASGRETATVEESSSGSTAEQAQADEGQDEGQRNCPDEEEAGESS